MQSYIILVAPPKSRSLLIRSFYVFFTNQQTFTPFFQGIFRSVFFSEISKAGEKTSHNKFVQNPHGESRGFLVRLFFFGMALESK